MPFVLSLMRAKKVHLKKVSDLKKGACRLMSPYRRCEDLYHNE